MSTLSYPLRQLSLSSNFWRFLNLFMQLLREQEHLRTIHHNVFRSGSTVIELFA